MLVKYLQAVHGLFYKCTSNLYKMCTGHLKCAPKSFTEYARTFSILHVKILSFKFIVADISITRTWSSSSRNMDDDLKHIFEVILSTDGPETMNLVVKRDLNPTTHVIKHILRYGTGVIRKKQPKGTRGRKIKPECGKNARTLSTASARTSEKTTTARGACAREEGPRTKNSESIGVV